MYQLTHPSGKHTSTMAINGSGGNGFPAQIMAVIEQKNFLQTKIRKSLLPTLVFRPRKIDPDDWFDARIGETKTFTRRALIAPSTTPLNPANNTGLDNGMTADTRSYEQWMATLNEYPGFIPTNILGQETLIADIYLDNMDALAQKAGSSMERLCSQQIFQRYDSGDTFVRTAETSSLTIPVDNGNGFDTQYPTANLPLYSVPTAVSGTNKLPVAIVDGTTHNIKALVNVTGCAFDTPNHSYMQNGGQSYGQSAVLTIDVAETVAIGDRIVALDVSAATANVPPAVGSALNPVFKDGSYVVRPLDTNGNMIPTAQAMLAANVMNPSVMIPYAVSIAKRRGVPKLANGLYGCAIDSTLLSSFYSDTGFQRATATNWDRGRYFTDGLIAAGWGVEFTEATEVPTYAAPSGSFSLRHAVVFGQDAISEHPFKGTMNAADIVAKVGDVADERWVDRIKFRSLAAIDTLGQVLKFAYDYVGDFQCGTDKASNPNVIQQSDFARFKRAVILQASAPY